jgi:hypothetical protein
VAAGAGLGIADDRPGTKGERGSDNEIMRPIQGLSLEIGGKKAIGYFETKDDACHLTLMVADANGETGTDSPGTRITVPVLPGRGLRLDTASGRSAEFFCGPAGAKMNARVFDRAPYKS